MANCKMCTEFDDCPWRYDPDVICSGFKRKPMSNADRIRSMSDEILADWMSTIEAKCYSRFGRESDTERFRSQWLDWLREEGKRWTNAPDANTLTMTKSGTAKRK